MTFADIMGTEQQGGTEAPAGGGFMERLKTDQAFAQAAIMMGARMMQGPRSGQDPMGVLGDAAMIGTQAYAMGKQNEVENQRAAERAQVQNAHTQAQTAGIQADTAGKVQTNAENVETKLDRVKALRLKAQALERAGKLEEAQSVLSMAKAKFLGDKAQNDPVAMNKLWEDELRQPLEDAKSKRNLQGAQANYYNAGAEAQSANAELTQAKKDDPEKFLKVSPSATVQNRKDIEARILAANPALKDDPAGLNAEVLRFETTAKHKATADAFSAFIRDSGIDISTDAGAKKAEAAFANHQKILSRLTGSGAQPAPGAAPAPAGKPADITSRFQSDPSMAGNSLAGPAPNGGMYVKDKSGKIIGTFK